MILSTEFNLSKHFYTYNHCGFSMFDSKEKTNKTSNNTDITDKSKKVDNKDQNNKNKTTGITDKILYII